MSGVLNRLQDIEAEIALAVAVLTCDPHPLAALVLANAFRRADRPGTWRT
jgi:hypothetical protein